MKTLQNIILTISLIISTLTFAQNDLKARIEFEEAEKQFNENNFSNALQYLEKTEMLIGKWTPKVSFMKIETLNKIADLSDLESQNSKKLINEVKLYMNYCSLHKDNVVMEKFKVVYAIDEYIKQITEVMLEGKMLEYVEGLKAYEEKKYTEAMYLWNKAVLKGNGTAMYQIGLMYYYGEEGNSPDYAKAMEWYLKAAAKGNVDAIYRIGDTYNYGLGVTIDFKKAMEWYLKAAEKGNVKAMHRIGGIYFYDMNSVDYTKALEWYSKASQKGMVDSLIEMATIYEAGGYGVKRDKQKAEELSAEYKSKTEKK